MKVTQSTLAIDRQEASESEIREHPTPNIVTTGVPERSIERLWLLWSQWRFLSRATLAGLLE